jgi:hypothetical protein
MPARIDIAPEKIAEGKFLYEQTDTSVLEICRRMEISRNALYARIGGWKWLRRRYTGGPAADADRSPASVADESHVPAPAPPDESANPVIRTGTNEAVLETPEVFYARVCRGVQRQMTIIERIQSALLPGGNAMQSERSARVLATINRALLEIRAMAKPDKVADEADDSIPRDIEEFRAQLARRIQGLVDAERERAGQRAGSDSAG